MASFIQPGTYAPDGDDSSSQVNAAISKTSRFLVYTNSILAGDELLASWYQYVILILGAGLLALTLARPLSWWILKEIARWKADKEPALADELEDYLSRPAKPAQQPLKSFGRYMGEGDLGNFLEQDYELHLIDIGTFRDQYLSLDKPKGRSIGGRSHVGQMGSVRAPSGRRSSINPTIFLPEQGSGARRRSSISPFRSSTDQRRTSNEIRRGSRMSSSAVPAYTRRGSVNPLAFPADLAPDFTPRRGSVRPPSAAQRRESIAFNVVDEEPESEPASQAPTFRQPTFGFANPFAARMENLPPDQSPAASFSGPSGRRASQALGPNQRRTSVNPFGNFSMAQSQRRTSVNPFNTSSNQTRTGSINPQNARRNFSIEEEQPRTGSLAPHMDPRRGSVNPRGSLGLASNQARTDSLNPLSDPRRPSIAPDAGFDRRRSSMAPGSMQQRRSSVNPFGFNIPFASDSGRRSSVIDPNAPSTAAVEPRRGSINPLAFASDLAPDPHRRSSINPFKWSVDFRKPSTTASSMRRPTVFHPVAPTTRERSNNVWIMFDHAALSLETRLGANEAQIIRALKEELTADGVNGLVIDTKNITSKTLRQLCNECIRSELNLLLVEDSDTPTTAPVYPMVAGVLFKNATIIRNGARRDFFHAEKLRKALARCRMQQKTTEDFFIGFLDLWDTRPHPATVRRAQKIARFHKAALHQAAADGLQNSLSVPPANCLSAFDWLKRLDIMAAQEAWMSASLKALKPRLPPASLSGINALSADYRLSGLVQPFRRQERIKRVAFSVDDSDVEPAPTYTAKAPPRSNFWTHSSQDIPLCSRGCYDVREEVFDEQYEAIVRTQKHLKRLDLLQLLEGPELTTLLDNLQTLSGESAATGQCIENLSISIASGRVVVYRGLDSGFRLPDHQGHFWSVAADEAGVLEIYVSLKITNVTNLAMVVLHTHLAYLGIPRLERLRIEMDIESHQNGSRLMPTRISNELKSSTYSELIFMLEQMRVSEADDELAKMIQKDCERLLVEEPSRLAFIKLQCNDLLAGKMAVRDLLKARLDQLKESGALELPSLNDLAEMSREMEITIQRVLYENDENSLLALSRPVIDIYTKPKVEFTPVVDLYALLFFCAIRKAAFEEIYLETTDRCPLFLQQKDQAAVFAEMWALGSQCEIYFGIKPSALGHIIFDRYRRVLEDEPPTIETSKITALFTAYQDVDGIDNDNAVVPTGPMTMRQRFEVFKKQVANATFLTVFCVPAVIDVCLLTFLGRGLYLTAFMSQIERVMANYAVLGALMMTAGVTGWTGSSGGFYLHSAAFNNMTHFMVERVSGGFMIACLLAVCGFVAFGIEYSWWGGFVFAAYTIVLSTYLNILGVLTTMHRNNSPFQSGRTVLLRAMLITLVSPVLTTFVNGHDILIYLLVMYTFLAVLIFSWLKVTRSWVTWMDNIYIPTEKEIMDWFQQYMEEQESEPIPQSMVRAQAAKSVMMAIKAHSLKPKVKAKKGSHADEKEDKGDALIRKLAKGHDFTVFMLKQDEPLSELPEPYGPTWLVKMKLALANQQQLAHGLKEHSPFLLYRRAKYDLAQNVGLFLIALLDRWVSISNSANGHVVNIYYDARSRYGIAFGLLYFLICAVCLDIILQKYWGKTGRTSVSKLSSLQELDAAEEADASVGRKRWFGAIFELTSIMAGVFGFCSIFVWLLVNEYKQIVLYFTYILGYSGVLIFQFNRVFTTNVRYHVQAVFVCAFVGYVVGCVLHEIPPTKDFLYNDVIALNIASLSAAFVTWLFTDFTADAKASSPLDDYEEKTNWKTYSQTVIGADTLIQQPNVPLAADLGLECRYTDETGLAEGIRSRFEKAIEQDDNAIADTFEDFREVLDQIVYLWENDKIRLFILERHDFTRVCGRERLAVSQWIGESLMVVVGISSSIEQGEIASQIVAEAMLHEACEGLMQMRHAHATVAELLLNEDEPISTRMAVQLAESKRSELSRIITRTNNELLKHLCLGVNPDLSWEQTPEVVRSSIVSRVVGRSYKSSDVVDEWLSDRLDSLLLRQVSLRQCLAIRELAIWRLGGGEDVHPLEHPSRFPEVTWQDPLPEQESTMQKSMLRISAEIYAFFFQLIQFIAVISTAGTDAGRELWGSISHPKLRKYTVWFLLKIWKFCYWVKEAWVFVIILSQDPDYKRYKTWVRRGASRSLYKGRILVSDPVRPQTGFLGLSPGAVNVLHYQGSHEVKPDHRPFLITSYDAKFNLQKAEFINSPPKGKPGDVKTEEWIYHYDSFAKAKGLPSYKSTISEGRELRVEYDELGRVARGFRLHAGSLMEYSYSYKPGVKDSKELLRARYTVSESAQPTIFEVYWCHSKDFCDDDMNAWIPCERVTRLVMIVGQAISEVRWRYDHKRDPVITRFPEPVVTTDEDKIELAPKGMGLLYKPTGLSIWDEDLLMGLSQRSIIEAAVTDEEHQANPTNNKAVSWLTPWRMISKKPIATVRYHVASSKIRTALWKYWKSRPVMSAMITCKLDEMILRHERTLLPYWKYRDAGDFLKARQYLTQNLQEVIAAIEIADEVAERIHLSIRTGDLFTMGLSKDSNYVIDTPEDEPIDTDDRLAVIFTDTGCWPDAPGGVSNCRRDLVDGHRTIRNYALTEGAYDWATPRFQVERNLQLVQNLPLWGLDGKSASHGLLDNLLQTQVDQRARATTSRNIKEIFIPILKRLIKGARTIRNSEQDLRELTVAFLRLNEYFETNDYMSTWRSNAVKRTWRECWLAEYDDANVNGLATCFPMERPTRQDFEEALELYIGYFFIFSIKIPEKVPRVYQSTHHGISSLFGMCLKLRRGVAWGIWDHAIMWRESCLNISTAQCFLPIPVQNMLLGMMKVASNLAYLHADIVLPCTDTFNPMWEIDIGTDQGLLASQHMMGRKIDPITNGIANMDSFTPVEKIRTADPTVIMLSNVQFIKDVKNAILAAGVIINDFGFKDYNLVVYGAQDRQPSYAVETEELITSLGIGSTVKLGGFGSPKEVLKDAWLFMNSSLSEGLPLAIGEAALAGIPIVATEVGATAQVLTDVDDPSIRYGEVVSPNDPVALARAQISLLAMLGPWAKYTKDAKEPPPLPSKFTEEDIEWITKRMHDKMEDRRALGMRLRDVVQRKFHGDRYLREHEQMYWVQRHLAEQRADPRLEELAASHPKFNQPLAPRFIEEKLTDWPRHRWQDFGALQQQQREAEAEMKKARKLWDLERVKSWKEKDSVTEGSQSGESPISENRPLHGGDMV